MMKVVLFILFLGFFGENIKAEADDQDDSSLNVDPFLKSDERELGQSLNDDTRDYRDFVLNNFDNDESNFCKGRYNGSYPNPMNCGSFYHCSNGITFLKKCPAGLHFNRTSKQCDWPNSAQCQKFSTTSRPFTRPPTTTRTPFTRVTARPPFTTGRLRCHYCLASSERECFRRSRVQRCNRNSMCIFAKGTRRGGQSVYTARCSSINEGCQKLCDKSIASGSVISCSIRCCFGDLCNGEQRFSTRPPFTSRNATMPPFTSGNATMPPFTRSITMPPFTTNRGLKCYRCFSPSKRNCFSSSNILSCQRDNICFFAKLKLRNGGFEVYSGGCVSPKSRGCQGVCDRVLGSGAAISCTVKCCANDFCNNGGVSTPRPFTTRKPTSRHHVLLRVLWRLLRATKTIIETLEILLRSHIKHNIARGYKREVTSMMNQVSFHVQRLGDSRDPEVDRVKQDIIATRMRAQAVIKKLDEMIGEKEFYDVDDE